MDKILFLWLVISTSCLVHCTSILINSMIYIHVWYMYVYLNIHRSTKLYLIHEIEIWDLVERVFHIFFLFCFSEAECTPLSNNPHVIADPGKDTYIAGDVVSFGCDNGYLLAGNSAISCDENGNIHAHICTHIYHSILYIHYQERMNPAEGGEGACNCYIKRCVNLWRTNCTKCPYMGKH